MHGDGQAVSGQGGNLEGDGVGIVVFGNITSVTHK